MRAHLSRASPEELPKGWRGARETLRYARLLRYALFQVTPAGPLCAVLAYGGRKEPARRGQPATKRRRQSSCSTSNEIGDHRVHSSGSVSTASTSSGLRPICPLDLTSGGGVGKVALRTGSGE